MVMCTDSSLLLVMAACFFYCVRCNVTVKSIFFFHLQDFNIKDFYIELYELDIP